MAQGIPSTVARRILELLGSESLSGELKLLQELKQTVAELAGVLPDAEKKSQHDEPVKVWLLNLENELYNADNLLDELSTEPLRQKSMTTGNKMANQVCSYFLSSRLKVRQGINNVTGKLKELATDRRLFNLEERSEEQVLMRPDRDTIVEEDVDFRDEDSLAIINVLLDLEFQQDVTVLPIVGMGGLGKTTLAKSVFNDERVQSHFEIRIWVTVSNSFDIKHILTEILVQVRATNRTAETLQLELLAKRTIDSLGGKRYLIVFDDVWNEDRQKWIHLMRILQFGGEGSKIIITTRSLLVAHITEAVTVYKLGILSEEQSWLLFKRIAFVEDPEIPQLEVIGKEIVKRCAGIPLAVKAIASMLRHKRSLLEWERLLVKEFSEIWNNDDDILPVLKLSYNVLPPHLKHCFAYCSLYPKDHEFDVQTMIKLWMAQGFIEAQTPSQSLEDVGYEYLLDLLWRSFFQGAEKDARGRVTKFQMHDLMHDLATVVAGEHCRMLYSNSTRDTHGRLSHVSIDLDEFSADGIQLFPAERLRSILLLGQSKLKYNWIPGNKAFEIITSRLRFLRALDMHALGITTVPHSISKLKLLRYLDLSENEDIKELPDSITMLLNLQTLRLSSCFGLKKLPRDFRKLVNLRHLEIDGCYNLTSLPRGIDRLPNLQTLSQLAVSEEASPNRLNNLREEVRIKNLGHGKNDMGKYQNVVKEVRSLLLEWESHAPESDEDKTPLNSNLLLALEELSLHGFRGESLFFSGCPSKLVKLSLRRCIKCQILPPLDQLSHLKVLVLDEVNKLEYISENASSFKTIFPSLQELWLTELPKLHGWWRNGVNDEWLPSFACLSKLVIEDCPKLASMPLFPNLEEGLVLDNTCWKPFQRTLNQKTKLQEAPSSSTSPSSLHPLSKLKALRIVGIEDFKADEITWEALKSLQFLRLDCLPTLEVLPEQLQQVTSLQELHLWRCGINEIPEWIGKLQNLEKLVIRVCPRLKSLPEAITKLLLLQTLEIEECDTLLRRCEKDIGADWEKITFIKKPLLGRIYGR